MFSFSTLIYEKDGSLTDEIMDDIVTTYHQDPHPHIVMYHPDLLRIKRYLFTEISSQLNEYVHELDKDHFFSSLLPKFQHHILDIHLHTRTDHGRSSTTEIHDTTLISKHKQIIQRLAFVWFLHDYDGILLFGNHAVQPKKGKLILYPLSWCIPVVESISKTQEVLTLRGTIGW